MSLPSSGIESFYRNSIKEVSKFFNEKHNNCYKIYNLCIERDYDSKWFNGNVVKYPIEDHNVPELSQIYYFSKDATIFTKQNYNNVIGVHCKGGKGRTGCMICGYLLYSCVISNSYDALNLFQTQRTAKPIITKESKEEEGIKKENWQGVTGPSQKRFVHYFELLLQGILLIIILIYK